MKNDKVILITGCAGFIGFHCVKKLSKDYKIVGIDNLDDYYDVELKKNRLKDLKKLKNFKFYKKNILKLNKFFFDKYNFEYVIHLAAQAGVRYSLENPQKYIDTNISGFLKILEFCKYNNKIKLIYASSSSIYGANKQLPFCENQKTETPLSMYAVSKKTNELMAFAYKKLYDIRSIGLRFFTVYGPWGRPDMALFKFTKALIEDKNIYLYNNGNHSRSFTYVDDIVNSIHLLIKKNVFEIDESFILNIGGSKSVNLMDYITCLEKHMKKKAKVIYLPMQKGDVEKTQSNVDKLDSYINYIPKVKIEEGIPKFVNWYKKYYNL